MEPCACLIRLVVRSRYDTGESPIGKRTQYSPLRSRRHPQVPSAILAKLRKACLALPEAHEEQAWVGTRWRIRKETFAHVLMIADGWPPVYARAAGTDGPVCVLTFQSPGTEGRSRNFFAAALLPAALASRHRRPHPRLSGRLARHREAAHRELLPAGTEETRRVGPPACRSLRPLHACQRGASTTASANPAARATNDSTVITATEGRGG